MNNTICSQNLATRAFSRANPPVTVASMYRRACSPKDHNANNCRTLNCVINGTALITARSACIRSKLYRKSFCYKQKLCHLEFLRSHFESASIEALNARVSNATVQRFAWLQRYHESRSHVLTDAWLCLRHEKKSPHKSFFFKTTAAAITVISAREVVSSRKPNQSLPCQKE